jgi:hypothetical protein
MKDKLGILEAISIIAIIVITQIILDFPEYIIDLSRNWKHCKYYIFSNYFINIFNNYF